MFKLLRIISCAVLTTLPGCGGGDVSSTSVQVAPAPTAPSQSLPVPAPRVAPGTRKLLVGASARFAVEGLPAGSTVSWSVSGAGCSGHSCGTIDSSGLFVAPANVPDPSTVTVSAIASGSLALLGEATVVLVPRTAETFAPVGEMLSVRSNHTATLLRDGRVLIAGGETLASGQYGGPTQTTAELYDPVTKAFSPTGSMNQARRRHTATLLDNGQVLITGPAGEISAELYDPDTGQFIRTGSLLTAQRRNQIAAPLPGGRVLIAGDVDAELFDPVTRSFTRAASYAVASIYPGMAASLNDGRVLLLGSNPSQIYDPKSDSFAITSNLLFSDGGEVELSTATTLTDGRVLIAGGTDEMLRYDEAKLYDPVTSSFNLTGSMNRIRDAHAAVRLNDGRVLVLGGDGMASWGAGYMFSGSEASAELYDPGSGKFTLTGSMSVGRTLPTVTLLQNGDVLVTGGILYCGIGCIQGSAASAELFVSAP